MGSHRAWDQQGACVQPISRSRTIPRIAPPSSERACAAALGAGLALLLAALYRGRVDKTSDELLMALTARSLALSGSLRFPETYGQTFTGYGVGTPAIGVPFVWLEQVLARALGVEFTATASLLPLASAACFLALAAILWRVLAAALPKDPPASRALAVGLALCASPLLPMAFTFYSEPLAALGLLLLASSILATPRASKALLVAAFLGAAAAVAARFALAPFAALVLLAGWRWRTPPRVLAAGAAGLAVGVLLRAAQNAALRGSPFAQGYDGQEFTTPLLTGLHGLLFSPERGLAVFWPLGIALLLVPAAGETARRWRVLGIAGLLAGVLFHAGFWTWHGGWTIGPRFLAPFIALALPAAAMALCQAHRLGALHRLLLLGAAAWSLWAALLYSALVPMDWWNSLWGFHQIESRWLFEPQLSLWRNWPALAADGQWGPWLGVAGAALGLLLLLALGVASSSRLLGARSLATESMSPAGRWLFAGVVLAFAAAFAAKGPTGILVEGRAEPARWLRFHEDAPDGPLRGRALLDLRPHGAYSLWVRADCAVLIRIDGRTLLEFPAPDARRLASASWEVAQSGPVLLEFEATPARPGGPLFLEAYWTWPGEGLLLEPVGGEFARPREPNALQRAAGWLWHRRGPLGALALASVLLIAWRTRERRPQTPSASAIPR